MKIILASLNVLSNLCICSYLDWLKEAVIVVLDLAQLQEIQAG